MVKVIAWVGGSILILGLLVAIFLPSVRRSREPARRSICKNNLKQIGIALHNYHDEYGVFPPAYTVDAEGNKLHSWRTLILPFIEQKALYETIDLTKPWDDPVNAVARETVIRDYACPSSSRIEQKNISNYLAIVSDDSAFPHAKSRSKQEFTDGLGETMFVVDVPEQNAVEWMSPNDSDEGLILSFQQESKMSHKGIMQVLLGDGAVQVVSLTLPAQTRRALMTVAGQDEVGEF